MRRAPLLAAAAAFALLAGCSSGGSGGSTSSSSSSSTSGGNTGSTTTSSTTSSTSTGGQAGASLSVEPCFAQTVAPGITVQSLLARDTLRLDLTKADGFPNGRRLQDPVIDLTLAYLFIDLSKHELDSLAKLAINPASNADTLDASGAVVPFSADFPFVVKPQGPPKAEGTGSNFVFRTNPASDFNFLDHMGNPAVGTILVTGNTQPAFNADTPADFEANGGKYIPHMKQTLSFLATALKDDFEKLSFTTCAK